MGERENRNIFYRDLWQWKHTMQMPFPFLFHWRQILFLHCGQREALLAEELVQHSWGSNKGGFCRPAKCMCNLFMPQRSVLQTFPPISLTHGLWFGQQTCSLHRAQVQHQERLEPKDCRWSLDCPTLSLYLAFFADSVRRGEFIPC